MKTSPAMTWCSNAILPLHGSDVAGQLKLEDGKSKRVIGRAVCRATIEGIWREDFRIRVERQINLMEAQHDPMEVSRAKRDRSKKWPTLEDDQRSTRKSSTYGSTPERRLISPREQSPRENRMRGSHRRISLKGGTEMDGVKSQIRVLVLAVGKPGTADEYVYTESRATQRRGVELRNSTYRRMECQDSRGRANRVNKTPWATEYCSDTVSNRKRCPNHFLQGSMGSSRLPVEFLCGAFSTTLRTLLEGIEVSRIWYCCRLCKEK